MFKPSPESSNRHSRATQFVADHILIREPNGYDAYAQRTIDAWKAEVARLGSEAAPRGFWLRNDDNSFTEHGALINYLVPNGEMFGVLAAINVSNEGPVSEIEVLLAKSDGSHEPVPVSREAYSLAALDRAISLVEEQVQ